MKNKILFILILFVIGAVPYSCTEVLEEEVYSELSDEYLKTEEGLNTILYSAYSSADFSNTLYSHRMLMPFFSSGHGYGQGGSFETSYSTPFKDFTWNSNTAFFSVHWSKSYTAIRDANILVDKASGDDNFYSEEYKVKVAAEGKAIRGYCYGLLYNFWGPVPVFATTETTDLERPRATDEEMLNRIETDLIEAATGLPVEPEQYGRMTKGAALSILCKHYLNTKQWQNCADVAQDVINLNKYSLLTNYANIFGVENEGNSEVIWVHPADVANNWERLLALVLPKDYPLLSTQTTWAHRAYVYDSFVDLFDDNDTRKNTIVTSYVNTSGETVVGYGNDNSFSLKYKPDPDANGINSGIDLIDIRYADILLARAEALNEINGPTQESIDLINQVRERAGVELISVSSFSKDGLRDFILEERFRELYFEGKEREDLIRHGKFISNAVARGANAKDYHVLYPIPQNEIDANSNINENNTGY